MDKNNQIHELLLENKRLFLDADDFFKGKDAGICFDGIVHEAKFEDMPLKLAFLLKDTNSNDENGKRPENPGDWDYRNWLERDQSVMPNIEPVPKEKKFYGKTYNKIAMWVESFFSAYQRETRKAFDEFEKSFLMCEEKKRAALRKIAIVNMKKTWGTSSISDKELKKYLESKEVQKVLEKELEIIKPDIVICGSTYWLIKEIFDGQAKQLTHSNGKQVEYFQRGNVTFLEFYHPANRKKTETQYDFAWDVFEALMKENG